MPFKVALALALSVVLSAPIALAAPVTADSAHAPAPHGAVHKAAKPGKSRPSSPKVAAVGKRKHTIDTKPDTHAISMGKPLDSAAPKADVKKGEPKKIDMKHVGKKREARRADAKKSPAKSGNDKQAVPVVAVAISAASLPPLPADEPPPVRTLLARGAKKGPCLHAPIHVQRGADELELSLTKCDGTPAPSAADKMGVLLRPGGTDKPAVSIDAGLIERLSLAVEHFANPGAPTKVAIISGSRPSSAGSYHASGRAMDVRIEGVKNEELVAFCKTLGDTGCGYYPNSSFVHMDVRDPGTGHVAWIDASGPGEAPRYVSQWPLPADGEAHDKKDTRAMIEDLLATIEKELPQVNRPAADASLAKDAPATPAADTAPKPADMERDLP